MLEYSIQQPEGILVLKPSAPLSKEDFGGLSAVVDGYLSDHAKLRGVLIRSKGFPGWESFGGFTAHMHFVRDHHKEVDRIAIVTDSHFAGIAQLLGAHFTSAEVRHFPFSDDVKAQEWLEPAAK
ncbi:STAS/SEC14 domain-containing protein [Variovorax sp. PAMC26660]|uniref:STAS/SEC14 domain-containing protein n=1 Tax=Variovorax sp. PAMC26660 TaxID=2762322 RepID=UPI00164ED676|nr:STAS/SEC14 domain-containing protein [Variovorax sp. PAMC26660]QNK67240.1 STAS/SEC14 domain-containing protein [Variovorax sp. PAMC26660]